MQEGLEASRPAGAPEAERERALLERAEQLAHLGSWEWAVETDELIWSDNMFRIYGLEPGEKAPTLEIVMERCHPEDRAYLRRKIGFSRRHGGTPVFEHRLLLPDRGVVCLRLCIAVVETRDGAPVRLMGFVQDITEQRRTERKIAAHLAVSDALVAWTSFETGAPHLVQALAEALGFVCGTLWLPEDGALVAKATWHSEGIEVGEFGPLTAAMRYLPGMGVPGRVWVEREPINLISMADAAARCARSRAATEAGLIGAVAFPALHRDDVIAVLEFHSTDEAELTEPLMRTLMGIGYELGEFLSRRRGQLESDVLTPREVEVLQLAARGFAGPQIAGELVVSPATIKTHFENIYGKLGVSDRAAAVARGLRLGLIE